MSVNGEDFVVAPDDIAVSSTKTEDIELKSGSNPADADVGLHQGVVVPKLRLLANKVVRNQIKQLQLGISKASLDEMKYHTFEYNRLMKVGRWDLWDFRRSLQITRMKIKDEIRHNNWDFSKRMKIFLELLGNIRENSDLMFPLLETELEKAKNWSKSRYGQVLFIKGCAQFLLGNLTSAFDLWIDSYFNDRNSIRFQDLKRVNAQWNLIDGFSYKDLNKIFVLKTAIGANRSNEDVLLIREAVVGLRDYVRQCVDDEEEEMGLRPSTRIPRLKKIQSQHPLAVKTRAIEENPVEFMPWDPWEDNTAHGENSEVNSTIAVATASSSEVTPLVEKDESSCNVAVPGTKATAPRTEGDANCVPRKQKSMLTQRATRVQEGLAGGARLFQRSFLGINPFKTPPAKDTNGNGEK